MFRKRISEGQELWIMHVEYGHNLPSDGSPDSYIHHTKGDVLAKVREIAKNYDVVGLTEKKCFMKENNATITVFRAEIKKILYPVERTTIELE